MRRGMSIKINKLNCIIDTMQVGIDINNFKDTTLAIGDIKSEFKYITHQGNELDNEGLQRKLRINLNNKVGYNAINGLEVYRREMEDAMKQLGIINVDEIDFQRIDIAIDSDMDFSNNFKFLLFVFECITYREKKSNRWYTTNLDTLKNNSIILPSRSCEVVFYDKNDESKGKHLYNTRQEFRFKRISSKDYKKHLNTLIRTLEHIDNNVEIVEHTISKRLLELWKIEKEELQSFSEFVRKYNNYFYTSEVLKLVYKGSGLKGSCRGWLSNFKSANNKITLFSKTDICKYKKALIKAIKTYEKN